MFEEGLAELHTHLGGSVATDIMWSLAHEQGIHLPTRDYWEFDRMVTVSDPGGARYDYTQIREHVELARDGGLGVTIHVGEEGGNFGVEEVAEVVSELRPDRLGHGILAAREPALMEAIREADITLEICPTSNLLTKALANEDEVRETFRTFVEHGVPFTIATDGPEMMRTHLRDEFELLSRIGALSEEELAAANERGHEVSFVAGRAHTPA